MSQGVHDPPAVRQCLLSFYSRNSTFATLRFTGQIQMHSDDEEAETKDGKEMSRINVLVLLAITDKYDAEIYANMHSCSDLELIMPFGSSKLFTT